MLKFKPDKTTAITTKTREKQKEKQVTIVYEVSP
jgi:preprotein translocase subunit Sec63